MPHPDNFNAAAFDAYWEGDIERRAYERQKADEANDVLMVAHGALVAVREVFRRVDAISHDYDWSLSYDPECFVAAIAWEIASVEAVAKAYGIGLPGCDK